MGAAYFTNMWQIPDMLLTVTSDSFLHNIFPTASLRTCVSQASCVNPVLDWYVFNTLFSSPISYFEKKIKNLEDGLHVNMISEMVSIDYVVQYSFVSNCKFKLLVYKL